LVAVPGRFGDAKDEENHNLHKHSEKLHETSAGRESRGESRRTYEGKQHLAGDGKSPGNLAADEAHSIVEEVTIQEGKSDLNPGDGRLDLGR
jgi:hypothetical protein